MKTSFIRNLQTGFGLSVIVLIITSALSYQSISELKQSAGLVTHTNVVLQQSEKVISVLKDAEAGQRGYLLTGNEDFLLPYKNAIGIIQHNIDSLQGLTIDNGVQQTNIKELRTLINQRLERLSKLIETQKTGRLIDGAQLMEGQDVMNKTRDLLSKIQDEEKRLLVERTKTLDFYSGVTPIAIIAAAFIAIFITFFFYRRVKADYDTRVLLQQELQQKDKEISARIVIIEDIASQISGGNYKIRLNDEVKDNLGKVSVALNAMAISLDESFEELSRREWMKAGAASLNEQMVGEYNTEILFKKIITFLVELTGSATGVFYLYNNKMLALASGYALQSQGVKKQLQPGENLAGQVAETGREIVLNNLPDTNITISYAVGEIRPNSVVAFPLYYERELKGVIELASFTAFTPIQLEFFKTVTHNIGTAIDGAQRRARLQELFEETQAQSEELQVQHRELEQINAELEAQSQKLQVSEEELKVQQEELLQSNQELEERSTMLEEKNQMIVERNLEIQKKAEELETTTRYKSEFMANMSHELRTPLNSILLLSRLLSENNDQNLNSEQIEFASVIQSSGNGLLTLIDEILDLSKIEAGKMRLEYADVSLKQVSENMSSLFTPLAKQKNLEFTINIDKDLPPTIYTDALRLEQVLKNLFSNALKFTARGSVIMNVKACGNEQICFAVRDTGIGIPPDKQQLVFEAFQQADGSTRRKYGGTGLGLSISRELAKLLGGEIKLNSEEGKGAEFVLTIPVNGVAVKDDAETFLNPNGNGDYSAKNYGHQSAPQNYVVTDIPASIPDDRETVVSGDKVILIIEDDVNFAQTLLNFTQKNNYKGLVAVRGDYGLQLAQKYRPMAILLDIKLPVKDGWQVMEELKSNPLTRHIPVHMMSSFPMKEESLHKGAIDFINKPVAFEQMPRIFKTIEEALTRGPRKILIVEENEKHAEALCYFLQSYNVNAKCTDHVDGAIKILQAAEADCVVLDMGVFNTQVYEELEKVKEQSGLENLPIILFTGKSLSKTEEQKIKKIADSIVVKTANSYKRILDEVALFLHIVEENDPAKKNVPSRKINALSQVLQNKTVLIADDDVRNIYSLTKALEAHKMIVVPATDGRDALEQLKLHPNVDIVLMDMMMPEMDGYEATQAVRKMPQFRNLPILAVTAKAMYADREKCIQAGASDYISKPVDVDQLVSLLRVWLYDKV